MGLIDALDKIFFGEEVLNRQKNENQSSGFNVNGNQTSEYLHPDNRANREDAKRFRIERMERNQYNSKISKMLEEIEKKDSVSRDKRGSIVALESLPEIIKEEIIKITGLPLNRLKEYQQKVDHDYSSFGDEKIFRIGEIQKDHPKYSGSNIYSWWQGEYLENEQGNPFLRVWPYKSY